MPNLVEDVRALTTELLKSTGGTKFTLVAHDWGGVVAWVFAALHPEMLDKLVIVNAPHPTIFGKLLREDPAQQKASAYMLDVPQPGGGSDAVGQFVRMADVEGARRRHQGRHRDRGRQEGVRRGVVAAGRADRRPELLPGVGCRTGSARRAPAAATTRRQPSRRAAPAANQPPLIVRVPTLVIWGEKDTALLTGNLDGLDQVVPKLTVRRIADGTHWVVREKPAEVNAPDPRVPRAEVAMAAAAPRFSAETLRFLRALKRNNRREWFNAHRDDYETHVRQPMTAIVERLADDFRAFAPELVASPKASMYRIYRDTRFSDNKTPYKTHIAAVFPTRGLLKHEGAGVYFHVSPDEVWIGGGMYSPQPAQLYAVREHIAANTRQLRAIVESPGFRRHVGQLEGEKLKRVPRGFPGDHRRPSI